MPALRSGKETFQSSGVQKNINARKNREDPKIAALRKEIQGKRKQRQEELETIKKNLHAIESQLKNSELTQDERDHLQGERSRFEKSRQEIEEEIREADGEQMDIDITESQGPNPTEDGPLFVQSHSADENETPVKTEHVEGSITHTQRSESASSAPTPETIRNSVEKGDPRNHVDPSDDDDDELLVGMKKLSTVDYSDGVADAWCRVRRTRKLIVRYGPRRAAKYVIQPGVGYKTDGLQEVSDAESRLCDIKIRDGRGEKRRRYGLENIVGIIGVAIMDQPHDSTSTFSKAPTTYIKIKWKDIDREHEERLGTRNWIRRTDLKDLMGEKMADIKIKEAWNRQEARYNDWITGNEIGNAERSPTPFPLDVYRLRREESRGPLNVRPRTTIKREETPLASVESREATEEATTPKPATVTNRLGATSSSETEAQVGSRVPDTQNSMEEGSSGQENNSESRPTFSQKQYKEAMIKDMDLDTLRREDLQAYVQALALIQAQYATYKAYMLKHGAIEVV
ncbi:hypothetical protein IFM51744_11189 [Aspergillus udagawae]|nr:hypothetical protein IFM51744_11189 [Aspergillus udagawae]